MALNLLSTSVEYVHVTWTASVTLEDTMPVDFAFLAAGTKPDGTTAWLAAAWTGSPSTQRSSRLLIGPGTTVPLDVGTHDLYTRVTDDPEKPVRLSGPIKVT